MKQGNSKPDTKQSHSKRLADYAMILDMVSQMTGLATEREQIDKIFDILATVCGPRSMCFVPLGEGAATGAFCRPGDLKGEEMRERLQDFDEDHRLTESGHGFIISIREQSEGLLGVLEVDDVSEPGLINHYLDVAFNIRGVLALAIANARMFQHELENRARIHNFVNQLAVLHDIGLSLNREADRDTLLANVLDGAGRLTSAGYGVISLVREEGAQIITFYQTPWHQNPPDLEHVQEINRHICALAEAERDVMLVPDIRALGAEPVEGAANDGLVGFLRDTRRRVRCYFFLMNKPRGEQFSQEDVDIISLLMAQGSVALVSLENFQREHQLAATLLDAIIPAIPIRDDIEIGLSYRSSGSHGVGGDFYDFIELGDNRLAIAVGDVSGKGLQAATYNAMVKYMLRAFLSQEADPGTCLQMLNQAIIEEIPVDKFITMGLLVVDTGARTVKYASAGHLQPIMCSDRVSKAMKVTRTLPLGVIKDFAFTTESLALEGMSTMVMYTDGIIESRSPEGESFGMARLKDLLTSCDSRPPQKIVDDIIQQVTEFCQGALKDDAAIMAIQLGR